MKHVFHFLLLLALLRPAAADLTGEVRNAHPPAGTPLSVPYSAATTSGGLDQQVPAQTPTQGGTGRLRDVVIGATFAGGTPDYFFGDVIAQPSGSWQARPVMPGDAAFTPNGTVPPGFPPTEANFYYSPHSGKVYATQPGAVTIYWKSVSANPNGPFTVVRRVHIVSVVPRAEPRRLFHNVASGSGPQVELPAGIEDVQFAWGTADFPVPTDPASDNVDNALHVNRASTLTYLKAQHQEGRIFMEFLGSLVNQEAGAREPLGVAVVDVLAEPVPGTTAFTVDSWLGEPLRPHDGNTALLAEVMNGEPAFIANRPVNEQPIYYGEHETENDDQVRIFWREPDVLGIEWPKFRNGYNLIWPDEATPGAYALNVLPDAGDGTAVSVDLFNENIPSSPVHQDTAGEAQVANGRFTVNPGADGANRSLLLLTNGGHYWYVRVYSGTQSVIASLPGALQTRHSGTVAVGDRISVPVNRGSGLSRAGHIHSTDGTLFHPSAYVDPMTAGFPDAELRSEIIPVNQVTGGTQVKVWWYRRMTPPAPGFAPLYWPSVIGTYTLVWPGTPVASQSSEYAIGSFPASLALDGILTNVNFTHTAGTDLEPWWRADYGENTLFTSVVIHNRQIAATRHRLRDITVEVLNEQDQVLWASELLNPENVLGGPLTINVPGINTVGRALRIRRSADLDLSGGITDVGNPDDASVLSLKEVVITATTAAREIIMASNAGSGALTPDEAAGSIYFQNDPALPGYNPNEEHALMLGGQAWALRDDLNVPGVTSRPVVLLEYSAPETGRTAMSAFRVLREKGSVTFDYAATAGTQLQAPMPLPVLPLPLILNAEGNLVSKNEEVFDADEDDPDAGSATGALYDRFTFEDRKGVTWIYRGPHGTNNAARVLMQYYYTTQPGFAFPNATTGVDEAPAVGSIQPYLRTLNGSTWTDTPETIRYAPQWPAQVPTLQFGETLTKAKVGLPAMRGQTSAQILYQQTRAADSAGAASNAVIFDPTRAKTYLLDSALPAIPADIATDSRNGKTYFQNLPPHLKERFYFNPLISTQGALVLEGKFVNDVVGDAYLLLNVLSTEDLAALVSLSTDTAWATAVAALTTNVETFIPNTAVPGTYIPDANPASYDSDALAAITSPDQAVDSYALTTLGNTRGFVTLVFGNGEAFTPEGEPVSLSIIEVGPALYTGQVKVLASANPLDEKVTLRHSADFAGRVQDYQFEWRYAPPANGVVPSINAAAADPGGAWIVPGTGLGNSFIVGGSGILALSDNYWIMRWSPDGTTWSPWTQAALVEGWIKRALAGINPFNQRVTDFFNNSVNTDVSILTQAGTRWEGDIALNLENINEFGLIEIYETILKRGINLSINGAPPMDYGPANDALLLAGGYLADLYTLIGDEAAADAANPTIAFDAQAIGSVADSGIAVDFESVFQQTATARFAFQGQVGNLLEEELALLRGRDDVNSPGVELSPSYNRMFWNYTRGITAGEVIYALNYNIRERQADSADGKIDATDAARMFPQAHGDAYGHYLTATKNYYRLLTDPQFTWAPRVEAVNVLGVPVQVDYLDERKFATAAARTAKSAKQIAGLVHRQVYSVDPAGGWQHFRDGTNPNVNYRDGKATSAKRTRHWGLDEWHARGAQGAYFHWIVANAVLPATSTATGIQKIDRTTVPELDELAQIAADMQHTADSANARLNPLGLAAGSTLFDISPTELAAGKSHFEQVQERATRALGNAFDTFDQATASTRLLRSLENQADDLSAAVYDQERAFNLELIELYGTPYAGDIGPGKTYAQGYAGPDLFRYFYIDKVTEFSDPFDVTGDEDIAGGTGGDGLVTFTVNVASYDAGQFVDAVNPQLVGTSHNGNGVFNFEWVYQPLDAPTYDTPITYEIRPDSPVQYASDAMGQRYQPGQIQIALQDLNAKREDMAAILDFYNRNQAIFVTELRILNESLTAYTAQQGIRADTKKKIADYLAGIAALNAIARAFDADTIASDVLKDIILEGTPTVAGTSVDPSFAARAAAQTGFAAGVIVDQVFSVATATAAEYLGIGLANTENDLDRQLEEAGFPPEYRRMAADVQATFYDWLALGSNIDQAAFALQQSRMALSGLLAKGQSVQTAREVFRKRAAAITQGYRTRDVAFRAFRTESLEQYQTLLDWAARYAFLAAKAYDYETGLLGTPQGQAFLNDIVSSRALGLRSAAGQPIFGASSTGDPGISGLLAKLNGDWSSVRTRLGFNNPDSYGTVFSFRQENYRIPGDTAPTDSDTDANNDSQDDKTWKEQMQSLIVPDIRTDADVALHCLQLSNSTAPVPGLIVPFSTTVQDGYNFFGHPLAAGDSAFSSTSFATKIHSVGIVFDGYVGMNAYATGSPTAAGPASGAPNALSATPYVFLIPTGQDVMRTPPLGDTSITREFDIQDYALPLPFNIGDSQFSNVSFWTGNDTLTEDFLTPRKHQAFRAVDHPFYFFTPLTADFSSRRLVGRSVWNTGWKLVIPANTLLNNTSDGLSRFLKSVRDIKLYVRSYSYSGN